MLANNADTSDDTPVDPRARLAHHAPPRSPMPRSSMRRRRPHMRHRPLDGAPWRWGSWGCRRGHAVSSASGDRMGSRAGCSAPRGSSGFGRGATGSRSGPSESQRRRSVCQVEAAPIRPGAPCTRACVKTTKPRSRFATAPSAARGREHWSARPSAWSARRAIPTRSCSAPLPRLVCVWARSSALGLVAPSPPACSIR
jgi:hypothetical protein